MRIKTYGIIPRRLLDVEAILDTCVSLACCTVEAIKTFLRLYGEYPARHVECMPTISIPIRRRSVCKVMRLETSAKLFLRINIEISVEALERKRNFGGTFACIFNFIEKTIESSVRDEGNSWID